MVNEPDWTRHRDEAKAVAEQLGLSIDEKLTSERIIEINEHMTPQLLKAIYQMSGYAQTHAETLTNGMKSEAQAFTQMIIEQLNTANIADKELLQGWINELKESIAEFDKPYKDKVKPHSEVGLRLFFVHKQPSEDGRTVELVPKALNNAENFTIINGEGNDAAKGLFILVPQQDHPTQYALTMVVEGKHVHVKTGKLDGLALPIKNVMKSNGKNVAYSRKNNYEVVINNVKDLEQVPNGQFTEFERAIGFEKIYNAFIETSLVQTGEQHQLFVGAIDTAGNILPNIPLSLSEVHFGEDGKTELKEETEKQAETNTEGLAKFEVNSEHLHHLVIHPGTAYGIVRGEVIRGLQKEDGSIEKKTFQIKPTSINSIHVQPLHADDQLKLVLKNLSMADSSKKTKLHYKFTFSGPEGVPLQNVPIELSVHGVYLLNGELKTTKTDYHPETVQIDEHNVIEGTIELPAGRPEMFGNLLLKIGSLRDAPHGGVPVEFSELEHALVNIMQVHLNHRDVVSIEVSMRDLQQPTNDSLARNDVQLLNPEERSHVMFPQAEEVDLEGNVSLQVPSTGAGHVITDEGMRERLRVVENLNDLAILLTNFARVGLPGSAPHDVQEMARWTQASNEAINKSTPENINNIIRDFLNPSTGVPFSEFGGIKDKFEELLKKASGTVAPSVDKKEEEVIVKAAEGLKKEFDKDPEADLFWETDEFVKKHAAFIDRLSELNKNNPKSFTSMKNFSLRQLSNKEPVLADILNCLLQADKGRMQELMAECRKKYDSSLFKYKNASRSIEKFEEYLRQGLVSK